MATRKPANGSSDKKFFDVAKPGKSMPPSTSRPAIVGHRTILKDPMVNTGAVASGEVSPSTEEPTTEKVVSTTAPTLKPLSVSVTSASDPSPEAEKTAVKPVDAMPEATSGVKIVPEADAEEAEESADIIPVKKTGGETVIAPPEHPEQEGTAETTESTQSTASTTLEPSEAQPAGSTEATAEAEAVVAKSEAEKQAEKASEAAAARVAIAEKLIADKTYFVPVGERRAQRSKKHVGLTLFLCLIGLLALAYLAIDSGMVKTSVELPVRLFRVE
ncbi:MAG: hypothetical protein KIH63_003880 [Candidatus Saccharibacteria bacterium]|nr:hypothetical protein [Candidatus Saccharibacteria bacterium]